MIHQPGVYVPLRALFLVFYTRVGFKECFIKIQNEWQTVKTLQYELGLHYLPWDIHQKSKDCYGYFHLFSIKSCIENPFRLALDFLWCPFLISRK